MNYITPLRWVPTKELSRTKEQQALESFLIGAVPLLSSMLYYAIHSYTLYATKLPLVSILISILFCVVYSAIWVARKEIIALFLLSNYVFQNVFIGLFSAGISVSIEEIKQLLIIKDIATISMFSIFVVNNLNDLLRQDLKKLLIELSIILLVCLYFIFFNTNIVTAAAYARNIIYPIIFINLGYFLLKQENFWRFLHGLIFILKTTIVFCVLELVTSFHLWLWLNAPTINTARGWNEVERLTTMIFQNDVFRLSGPILDSVNFAYFLATAILILLANKSYVDRSRHMLFYLFIASVFLFLTFGKGGILILGTGMCAIMLTNLWIKRMGLILLLYSSFIILIIPVSTSIFPTLNIHLIGLSNALGGAIHYPMGHGLGSGGNFAQGFGFISREEWLESSESAIGVIIFQMGIFFMLIYWAYFVYIACRLKRSYVKHFSQMTRIKKNIALAIAFILAIVTNMFVQENALSPQANMLIFIFIGYCFNLLSETASQHAY